MSRDKPKYNLKSAEDDRTTLRPEEVDAETFYFLKMRPETTLKIVSREESINTFSKILLWALEEVEKGKDVNLLVFSGEADPDFWNSPEIEKPLLDALYKGLSYVHCLGPVICVDQNGKHASLTAYQKFPERVSLMLFPDRYPYHWFLCYSKRDDTTLFKYCGECYHHPLTLVRKKFLITLDKEEDPITMDKMTYLYSRVRRYEYLKPFLLNVSCIDDIPVINKERLRHAYEKALKQRIDFDALNSRKILELA